MVQRCQPMLAVAVTVGSLLAAGVTGCQSRGPSAAAPLKQTSAPPAATATKPAPATAKTAAGKAPPLSPGMIPGGRANHPPPAPPATSHHNRFEIPQAKSLGTTPDMVLSSRVTASLMSALQARNTQDIEPRTTNGVVTLTGTVNTPALRARAEQVARGVHGVRGVRNQLTVK